MSQSSTPETSPPRKSYEYDLSQMQPWREYAVFLFDDMEHDVGQVQFQLMKALGCSPGRALCLTLAVDTNGRATVAITGRGRALQIATILRQINLRVSLRQTN